MEFKIFISNYRKDGILQSDEEVIKLAKNWINQVGFKYNIKDIKKSRLSKKLLITIYYEEKPI